MGLAEALELTLLLADKQEDKYERAAGRWHARFLQEVPNVGVRQSQAILAAAALAEFLSRRRSCERIAEALVRWSRAGQGHGSQKTLVRWGTKA